MKTKGILFRLMYYLYDIPFFGTWYTRRQLSRIRKLLPDGHTNIASFQYGDCTITAIPQNADNYTYMIECKGQSGCALVDVGDANVVLQHLDSTDVIPEAVLVTHKHWDHCYGNKMLLKHYPDLLVYGGYLDMPAGTNHAVHNADVLHVGNLRFKALHVPGHTNGHIVYLLECEDGHCCLFTGDFLFTAGIGKDFEGGASQMLSSLLLLNEIPMESLVFPGHEYAEQTLSFALSLESENEAVKTMFTAARKNRAERLPFVPITLQEQYKVNPFLRTNSVKLRRALISAGYDLPEGATTSDNSEEAIDKSFTTRLTVFEILKKAKEKYDEESGKKYWMQETEVNVI